MQLTKENRTAQIVDGDFTTPVKTSMERIVYPFEGDIKTIQLQQDYIVYMDYYLETVPQLGEPHPDYPNLYFVYDTQLVPAEAGLGTFTRVYSALPGSDNEALNNYGRVEGESYVWTKPGIESNDALFQIYFVSTIATNGSYLNLTTSNVASLNITSNDKVIQVKYKTLDRATGIYHDRQAIVPLIAVAGLTVTISPIIDIGPIIYEWFSKAQTARDPIQLVVPSLVYYDYYLPGVNCTSIEDIPIIQKWTIYDASGNETEYLSATSHPPLYPLGGSEKSYQEMVRDKDRIVVEPSTIRRWIGPIFERVTRYIRIV